MKKKREPLKLNLGCGRDKRPGYINIDVDQRFKPDIAHDLLKPLPFENESAQEIILQDVLEHFTKEQAKELLRECSRVLKLGGLLQIRVPSVASIFAKYHSQPDLLMLFLYGDTTVSGTWGAHKYGYTPEILAETVAPMNLTLINQETDDTNYVFTLIKQKLSPPKIVVRGSGWYPDFQKISLPQFIGKTVIVCTDLQSLLNAICFHSSDETIVWCISRSYPVFLSKLILRPLSKNVTLIVCKNESWEKDAIRVLRFSHLRILTAE